MSLCGLMAFLNRQHPQNKQEHGAGAFSASINVPLQRGPWPDRVRVGHFVRPPQLLGTEWWNATGWPQLVFINVIQALWIAVTTTEGPGDMRYAAGKGHALCEPATLRVRLIPEKKGHNGRHRPAAMLRECSQHRPVATLQDEKQPTYFSVLQVQSQWFLHICTYFDTKKARQDSKLRYKKKNWDSWACVSPGCVLIVFFQIIYFLVYQIFRVWVELNTKDGCKNESASL